MKPILMALFLLCSNAFALFQIQPYLGYSHLDSKTTTTVNSQGNQEGENIGLMLGIRLFPKLRAGYDYSYGDHSSKGVNYIGAEYDNDVTLTNHGPFVAWDFSKDYFLHYTFITNSELDPENGNIQEGSGSKISLGINCLKMFKQDITLMLNYYTIEFDESPISSTPFETELEGLGFSFIFPIEL